MGHGLSGVGHALEWGSGVVLHQSSIVAGNVAGERMTLRRSKLEKGALAMAARRSFVSAICLSFGLYAFTEPSQARKKPAEKADQPAAASQAPTPAQWTVPEPKSDDPEAWLARLDQAATESDLITNYELRINRPEAAARQAEFNRITQETSTRLTQMGDRAVPAIIAAVLAHSTGPFWPASRVYPQLLASIGEPSVGPLLDAMMQSSPRSSNPNGPPYSAALLGVVANIGNPATERLAHMLKEGDDRQKKFAAFLLADLYSSFQKNQRFSHHLNEGEAPAVFLKEDDEPSMLASLDGCRSLTTTLISDLA